MAISIQGNNVMVFLKPSSLFHLTNRKKWRMTDGITSRIKPAEDTLDKIIPICQRIGVTRLADITYMDKLYIPNYSAVLPGTDDKIWVYSGKGQTKVHAKASALMEAIERYSSLSSTSPRKYIQESCLQLSKSHSKLVHPAEVVEPVKAWYKDDMLMDFLPGYDLLNDNEKTLVPAQLALFTYSPKAPAVINPFTHFHTNGLASGNVIEEAICHALCEVIERDAVSIADLCASAIPHTIIQKITNSLKENRYPTVTPIPSAVENKFVDDSSIFPDVDISEIEFEPVKILVKKFADAGLQLLIKNITQEDIGIPTFIASSIEWVSPHYGDFAYGHGTHPDARIALTRAITEVSQERAGNIQGARDDLGKTEYKKNDDDLHKRQWQFIPSSKINNNTIKFSEIKTYVNEDILDDIKLILQHLRQSGLKRAIIVDLTNPTIGIPVVRVIVPGLETFSVSRTIMGSRAKKFFFKKRRDE